MSKNVKLGPLGLLPSFSNRGEDILKKLTLLENFSLEREFYVIQKKNEIKLAEHLLPTLEREFKRFFSLGILIKSPKYDFAPTPSVDAVWHELILDTKRYFELCESVQGAYVHHIPLGPKQIAVNAGEVLGYTKECLENAYGAVTPSIWGEAKARCDYSACSNHNCVR